MFDKNTIFITYGLGNYFNSDLFKEVVNDSLPRNKPKLGGLWSSPVDSELGWKDFCIGGEYYKNGGLDSSFRFTLKQDAKVLEINTPVGFDKSFPFRLSMTYKNCYFIGIDFEKMRQSYDAMYVSLSAFLSDSEYAFRDNYLSMYGYDCETLLVLNKDCIIPVID